jgi:L-ascorbate metabolism protein UlaG (beta-lactamase superfamily)
MKRNYTLILKSLFSLMLVIMMKPVFSQDVPEYDKINTSAGIVEMHYLGHGSLMFKVNYEFVIFIDPVSTFADFQFLPKADLILVTHEHGDHLDAKVIDSLKKPNTLLFLNQNSSSKVFWGMVMKNGDRQEIHNIVIEAVPAYNIVNERAKGQPYHPKGEGNGYILTIGGKKFYIAGDTENTPEMKALKNIDVAFLPMNLPYTMTPEMVADAALAFKPRVLIPYHYGDTDTGKIVDLLKNSGIKVWIRNLK